MGAEPRRDDDGCRAKGSAERDGRDNRSAKASAERILALAFGPLNGFAFGATLADAQPFAGAHRALTLMVFVAVAIVGQSWLAALMWATRAWLHRLRLHERVAIVVASVLVAHSAVDRVVERGHLVAQAGSFAAERALLWLTLGWACVMLLAALAEFLRERSGRHRHGDAADAVNA